jgi:hypothetical protein
MFRFFRSNYTSVLFRQQQCAVLIEDIGFVLIEWIFDIADNCL